ncbi:hypothetical protein FA15DRAFT_710241 [Coprinopsis marcescibilis]|uniref:Uncharacterized protein n=1 Tax=Coprinopsis marcescibilis TaxID=230819 RepID=A0A5C3KEB2_COPMA|nr:hypothetical protein FA15DRAFT_710241 [Coprinopsis marcescibilis]
MANASCSTDDILLFYENSSPRFTVLDSGGAQVADRSIIGDLDEAFAAESHATQFRFEGLSCALFGALVVGPTSQTSSFTWTLLGEGRSGSLADPQNPKIVNGQWFKIQPLADIEHTIHLNFTGGEGVAYLLRYAVVRSGFLQNYDDQTKIMVDNMSTSELEYFGQWVTDSPKSISAESAVSGAAIFGNSTHRASGVGAGIMFRFLGEILGMREAYRSALLDIDAVFSGTSLRMYGVSPQGSGFYNVTFTMDGGRPQTFKFESKNTTSTSDHIILIDYPMLSPTIHTFSAIMTHQEGERENSLVFDFLTYRPAFPNRGSKPCLSPIMERLDGPMDAVGPSTMPIVVGGILAAIAGLAVLISILVLCIWRRRLNNLEDLLRKLDGGESAPWNGHSESVSNITPFVVQPQLPARSRIRRKLMHSFDRLAPPSYRSFSLPVDHVDHIALLQIFDVFMHGAGSQCES